MEAEKFLVKFKECITNFRKSQNDTYDDDDAAHFFDPKLKKFLIDNKKAVDALFELRSLVAFQKFVTGYIWKGK